MNSGSAVTIVNIDYWVLVKISLVSEPFPIISLENATVVSVSSIPGVLLGGIDRKRRLTLQPE
jgi:hypothetical protein